MSLPGDPHQSRPSSRWPSPAEELSALRAQAEQVVPAARTLREPRRWWAWAAWGVTALAWLAALVALALGPETVTVWDDGDLDQVHRWQALLLLVVLGAVLLPMPWLSRMLFSVRTLPWVNLPYKEFWVRTPRRLARAERIMGEVLAVLTLWSGALCGLPVLVAAVASRNGGTPPEWAVPAGMGALLVLLPLLLVWLVRAFDPERAWKGDPPGHTSAEAPGAAPDGLTRTDAQGGAPDGLTPDALGAAPDGLTPEALGDRPGPQP